MTWACMTNRPTNRPKVDFECHQCLFNRCHEVELAQKMCCECQHRKKEFAETVTKKKKKYEIANTKVDS